MLESKFIENTESRNIVGQQLQQKTATLVGPTAQMILHNLKLFVHKSSDLNLPTGFESTEKVLNDISL